MDSSGFSFGIDTSITSKNQSKKVGELLVASQHLHGNNHILMLLELPPPNLSRFTQYIKLFFKEYLPNFDYDVVIASAIHATLVEVKKHAIYKFYQDNTSDYYKYIKPNTVVISSGYALQSITKADDISIECFYDYMFNKTYFYSPQLRHYVFPIDSFTVLTKFDKDRYIPVDCSRYEFAKLQCKDIIEKYTSLSCPPVPMRIRTIKVGSRQDWLDMLKEGTRHDKIAFDVETSGFTVYRHRVGCITVSYDGKTGYYIPVEHFNAAEFDVMLVGKYQIGANKKFDDKFLRLLGCKNVYTHSDTLHLGHLLNEMRFNGLKSHAYHYTLYGGYDYALDQYIQKFKPNSYLDIPILPDYAVQDAIHTYNVEAAMQKQLTELDARFPPPKEGYKTMRSLYEDIIIPYVNIFTDMELEGICVDMEQWESGANMLYHDILGIKEELRKQLNLVKDLGYADFDSIFEESEEKDIERDELQSGKQLGEILEKLGWENLGKTKQGWYKTADDQLVRWAQLGHHQAPLIQKLRSYLTMQKSFMGLPDNDVVGWRTHVINHDDGSKRIHPNYRVMLTDTYRNACNAPNLQNLPSSSKNLGEMVEKFKRIIVLSDKKKSFLAGLDYAAFQIRLAAIDSKDPVLMKAFQENPDADIHSKTAFTIFCKGVDYEVEEVLIQEGNHSIMKFGHEEIKVMREGKEIKVQAKNLLESDVLVQLI